MGILRREYSYPLTPRQVQEIHRDPNHWHKWIAGAQGPGEVNGDGSAGTTCRLTLKVGGLTQPYRIEVKDITIDDLGGQWVGTISSPNLRVRETRTYRGEGAGTHEIWNFEYKPVGLMGLLLRPFMGRLVAQQMDRTGRNFETFCREHIAH